MPSKAAQRAAQIKRITRELDVILEIDSAGDRGETWFSAAEEARKALQRAIEEMPTV